MRELKARCAPWKERLKTEVSAVGEAVGEANLHLRHQSTEQASLLADWEGTTLAVVPVPITTLDTAIKTYGRPDFCKIDVEGYEYHVLQGLSQPIPLLSLEYHVRERELTTIDTCLKHLSKFGSLSLNTLPADADTWAFSEWLPYQEIQDRVLQVLTESSKSEYGDLFVRMA